MPRIFIGVGSNIRREYHIVAGLRALNDQFGELECSPVYDTAAVGFAGDNFFNMVVSFRSDLPLNQVGSYLTDIENCFQRDRNVSTKFCARTLDLDLLLYGSQVTDNDAMKIPRKDVYEQAYVLVPLVALDETLRDPVSGRLFREILADFNPRQYIGLRPSMFDPFAVKQSSKIQ